MSKAYKRTELTGGTVDSLDTIDGDLLSDGDFAFVLASGSLYIYNLDADSGAAESSPDVIAPDTNAGAKRWILQRVTDVYSESEVDALFTSHSSSGDHDGRYYTETEVDDLFTAHSSSGDHDTRYTQKKSGVTTLVNNGNATDGPLLGVTDNSTGRAITIPFPAGCEVSSVINVSVMDADTGSAASGVTTTIKTRCISITATASAASAKVYVASLDVSTV